MSDPHYKMSRGEPVAAGQGMFNAAFQRKLVDVAKQHDRDFGGAFEQFAPTAIPINEEIFAINISWGQIEQFSPLGIGDLASRPASTTDEPSTQNFYNQTIFLSADPSAGQPFAIALEPIPAPLRFMATAGGTPGEPPVGDWLQLGVKAAYDNTATYSSGNVVLSASLTYAYINAAPSSGHAPPNPTYWQVINDRGIFVSGLTVSTGDVFVVPEIGRVTLFGAVKVWVNVTNAAHKWAAPATGNYDYLVSQSTPGPARVIWAYGGTGQQWTLALLGIPFDFVQVCVPDPCNADVTKCITVPAESDGECESGGSSGSGSPCDASCDGANLCMTVPDDFAFSVSPNPILLTPTDSPVGWESEPITIAGLGPITATIDCLGGLTWHDGIYSVTAGRSDEAPDGQVLNCETTNTFHNGGALGGVPIPTSVTVVVGDCGGSSGSGSSGSSGGSDVCGCPSADLSDTLYVCLVRDGCCWNFSIDMIVDGDLGPNERRWQLVGDDSTGTCSEVIDRLATQLTCLSGTLAFTFFDETVGSPITIEMSVVTCSPYAIAGIGSGYNVEIKDTPFDSCCDGSGSGSGSGSGCTVEPAATCGASACDMELGTSYGPFDMTPFGGAVFRVPVSAGGYHVTLTNTCGSGCLETTVFSDCPTSTTLGAGFTLCTSFTAVSDGFAYIVLADQAFSTYTYTIRVDTGACP